MCGAVPAVESSHDAHGLRVGCPHGKCCSSNSASNARVLNVVGSENLPQALVAALANEVEIELAHGGGKTVGIVSRPNLAVWVTCLNLVVEEPQDMAALPDAVFAMSQRDTRAGAQNGGDFFGQGAKGANDVHCFGVTLGPDFVLTENAMRVVVRPLRNCPQHAAVDVGELPLRRAGFGRGLGGGFGGGFLARSLRCLFRGRFFGCH